jgi:hypothetical protein
MGSVSFLGAWASYERPLRPDLIQMAAYELVGTPFTAGTLRITDEVAG